MNKSVAAQFAQSEFQDFHIYQALAKLESNKEFKEILKLLSQQEHEHYTFWMQLAGQKIRKPGMMKILIFILMRKILGLTFTAKYMEREEKATIESYHQILKELSGEDWQKLQKIIEEEKSHEKEFISRIKEDQVKFISSIILGLNDGLIELTGALVGFTFALANHLLIALMGMITGISASLSMASSAYMQAKHEEGKDAKKAAFYTGVSYIIVVLFLTIPFFLIHNNIVALATMGTTVFIIIAAVSYYTSVLFERIFKRQFSEILIFSIGVALISFLIGSLVRCISGIQT